MKIGTLAIKIGGRDAGCECVVVDVIDKNFVLIDGNTRRRKCNINHLEPIGELNVKKNASHDDVIDVMGKSGIKIVKKGVRKERAERKVKKEGKSKKNGK